MDNIFDTLLHLPLFQGVSHERLRETVEKVPFHFLKFKRGEKIIDRGDKCTHVRFIVSGNVRMTYESRKLKFSISHELSGPEVIAPDYLFGLDTSYPFTLKAIDECGILQLSKNDYVSMLQTDNVFLYNILNYLSRNSQSFKSQLLNAEQVTVTERLVMLVSAFTSQRSKNIVLEFRQRDLCRILGARRPALMTTIDELMTAEYIEMPSNTTMLIKDRKQLLEWLKK
jgi:CRP-like cAMP-binding protein